MIQYLRHGALLMGLASLMVIPSGCKKSPSQKSGDGHQILLLAIDGLEWDVVLPMIRAGRLPNMRRIMEEGTFGLLDSFEPTWSPVIWTSAATGKDRAAHGILAFEKKVRRKENEKRVRGGTKEKRLYNSTDRKTKAFWNILSDYNKRVNMVGWFVTFPAEEINGVMVSQAGTNVTEEVKAGAGTHKGYLDKNTPQQVYPPERTSEVLAFLDRSDAEIDQLTQEIFGTFPHPMLPAEARFWKASHFSFKVDSTYAAIAHQLAVEDDYDLMAMYIGGTDTVAHRYWRHMEPQHYKTKPDPKQVENFGDVIRKYYVYADRVVGDLIKTAGPGKTVILMSDHGMHQSLRNVDNEFLVSDRMPQLVSGDHRDAPPGVLMAVGPGIKAASYDKPIDSLTKSDLRTMGSVFDITPTLLALLEIPVGEDMIGAVATSVIDDAFLAAHPPTTVVTHDTPEWRRLQANRPVPKRDSREYRNQLKDLGYTGDDAADDPDEEDSDDAEDPSEVDE